MKRPSVPIALLCLVALFLPIWGGQISTDRLGLAPGGLLAAIFGGLETPLLTHAIFAALIAGAVAITLWKRQIIQVPNVWIGLPIMLLCASILASILYSSFKVASIAEAAQWLTFGMAAFATTMCLGRREGPRLFLRALVAGCAIAAILAIMEYNGARALEPNHRVFGGWINPNALAGVLTVGVLCSLGLCVSGERMESGLTGVAVAIQILALWLTGSRAGFLAAAFAIVVFFVLILVWRVGPLARTGRALGALVAGALLVALLIFSSRARSTNDPGAPSGLGRVVAGVGAGDQSAAFRKLLYKGAFELVKDRPMGYGIGTYRYYSAKPGLTTQTQYTHDVYLQLLVECGPVAAISFLLGIGAWLYFVLRRASKLPAEQNTLRAAVVAAVVSMLAQGAFESNLYYFGMGAIFFLLLGTGTLIADDAVAPEFMAKNLRLGGLAAILLVPFALLYLGIGEMFRAEARYALTQQDVNGAKGFAQSAAGMLPGDADALGLLTHVTTGQERLDFAKKSAAAGPNTSALRRLAELEAQMNDMGGATESLDQALALDPNNLITLSQLLALEASQKNDEAARATAKRMVDVEQSPYFQIRSLPELIPTETLDARLFLAAQEPNPVERAKLMREAVDGYVKYAQVTVPPVIRLGDLGYGEENTSRAKEKIKRAQDAAHELLDAYRAMGDSAGVSAVEEDLKSLDRAAEDLSK